MKRALAFALVALALLYAGCVSSPVPTATPRPATPTPLATAPQNITVTLPPGYPTAVVTVTHYIHGIVTYNGQPVSGYRVKVDTDKGNEYSNVTDASGSFNVTFLDDGSSTYRLELMDSGGGLVYQDSLPRYLNATGPMSISIEVPGPGMMNVTIA